MSKIEELINKIENKSNDPYSDRFGPIDIEEIMKEYAKHCMDKLKDEIFIYGTYDINDPFGENRKEIEHWIKNFKHE